MLEVPEGAIIAVRFVDGSPGFIVARSMSIEYEEVLMAMSADDMQFRSVGDFSIADLAGSAMENLTQDAVLEGLLRRVSGPVGTILDFSEARPLGRGAGRLLVR
jgi:hypothetical protein